MHWHTDWNIRETPDPMQLLINVTVFFYGTPVFYKVSKMNESDYYAVPTDKNMRSIILKKISGCWISEGGSTEWQAIQIGEKIDKLSMKAEKI